MLFGHLAGTADVHVTGRGEAYDVFLSHRGPDTKRSFSIWLRNELERQNIRTFFDDRSLGAGDHATEVMIEAMRTAEWGIVVLSPNFFSSAYCMEELKVFLDRRRVIPLGFNLTASDCDAGKIVSRAKGTVWEQYGGKLWETCGMDESEWRNSIEQLAKVTILPLRVFDGYWDRLIAEVVRITAEKLGRPIPNQAKVDTTPYPRNARFIGRVEELAEIVRKLGKGFGRVCISGIAGIGKTQLALEYVYTHGRVYNNVLWVDASPEVLSTSYLKLGSSIAPGKGFENCEDGASGGSRGGPTLAQVGPARLRESLENLDNPCLLVFDNVEEDSGLSEFVPRRGPCHVIVTTRLRMVSNFDKLELGKLMEREGLELLKGMEIFDKEEAKALENLAARFDYLTLALDMSSRLLAQGRYSPASLNNRLNKKGLALFEGLQDPVFHKNPDLVPLFQASFDMLAKDLESTRSDKEIAKVLISVGGWFASAPIRKELLASGVSRLPRLDESAVTVSMTCSIPEKRSKNRYPKDICIDGFCAGACFPKDKVVKEVKPDQVETAIGLLNFYSLMTRGNHGKVIIHKLVQAFGRRQAPLVGGVAMVGALMDVGQLDLDWEHFVYAFESVLPEGGAPRAGIRLEKEDEVRFIQRIGVPVLKLYVKGFQPSTALSLASRCRRALVELEEPSGGAVWVRLLSVEARAHDALGNYNTSEGLWRQVVDHERTCAQDCRHLVYALESLAYLLYIQGKCKEAETLYRRTLDVWQNVSDGSPLELSIIFGNFAHVLECLGKYNEAEVLLRQSYKSSEEIRGSMHLGTALALNDLGNLAGEQGNYYEAETHFRNCLSIAEGTQKSNLLAVAACGHNLAFVLATLGRYIEAESLLQRAWDIREKLLGRDHPETTAVFSTMGYVYQRQGRYSEAKGLFRRGLRTWKKVHGHVHPNVARNLDRLGSVLEYEGKYMEARVAYEDSIRVFTEVFGPDHLETGIVLGNLGGLLERQGHFVEAEILFRRSLEIVQKTLGLHHLTTAAILERLGHLLLTLQRAGEAEPLLRQSLLIRKQVLGETHADTLATFERWLASNKVRKSRADPFFDARKELDLDQT